MSDEEKLLEFGFSPDLVKKALIETNNAGLQVALDWIAKYQENPNEGEQTDEVADNDPKSLRCNDCQKLFSSVELAQLHATRSGHQDFSEAQTINTELTAEEKSERLALLKMKLAEKRKLDTIQSEKDAKEAEILRRKSGHAAAEARREIAEREMVKAAEQMRKDKEEEKLIRARIKAEMEEEKRLRKAQNTGPSIPTESIKLVSQESSSCRIQVKLPGGDSLKATFKPEDKFCKLFDSISNEKGISLTSDKRIFVPFPRKLFDLQNDGDKTFMELGLCPSASLVLE